MESSLGGIGKADFGGPIAILGGCGKADFGGAEVGPDGGESAGG